MRWQASSRATSTTVITVLSGRVRAGVAAAAGSVTAAVRSVSERAAGSPLLRVGAGSTDRLLHGLTCCYVSGC